MVRLRFYVLLGFLALAAASPAIKRRAPMVKDSLPQVPQGWTFHRAAPAHHMIKLRIGLPQFNFAELEKALYEVSDPTHERYGAHLSKEEVEELVAPHPESLDLVEDWLASHGLDVTTLDRSPAKDWITIAVPVHLAESMLDTKYNVYKHDATGTQLVRAEGYSLPEYLHAHVDVVQPTTMFGRGMRAMAKTSPILLGEPTVFSPADNCTDTRITPACLQDLYKTKGYAPKVPGRNKIGVTGWVRDYANFADLKQFYQAYAPAAVDSTPDVKLVHGGQNDQNISLAGDEANFDIQYATALTYPTPVTFFSTGGSPPYIPDLSTSSNTNEPYADWLCNVYVCCERDFDELPQTITTSYGDGEQTVPRDYAIRVCNEFAQLGARGVSIFFSSGDDGVGGSDDPNVCRTNDGKNTTTFLPEFPTGCPYVTSVGATRNLAEVAVSFTGGGFSNYFPRPNYQRKAVEAYLKTIGSEYAGLYNITGRAYPDVAALGTHFRYIYKGKDEDFDGTSAAAPTFASVISLINDALIANGRSPLGFLNPWLYSTGYAALNDITSGTNPGCNTTGFAAAKGWDPVTGFGSPNFEKILALLGLEK
ncbi:hypothetical protein BOTBODRAFT_115655 [Botryobasidium botryosum FD-172 SS1]|uniref:tripeptidyl-peptidase II n=1 Tax=Botryobasidium botryosum (strain FD-172 SS1) TaxID=930990 RepID=A0A067M454_BOTB1|nr:hypothetical protein BOTBODRAFT_115655 [Botryobasidium botryosum FD-172 SS1]